MHACEVFFVIFKDQDFAKIASTDLSVTGLHSLIVPGSIGALHENRLDY